MSAGFNCKCPERAKPVAERAWRVTQRNYQTSAFSGYRKEYTARSTVQCTACRCIGRTSASYVDRLPDAPADWFRL